MQLRNVQGTSRDKYPGGNVQGGDIQGEMSRWEDIQGEVPGDLSRAHPGGISRGNVQGDILRGMPRATSRGEMSRRGHPGGNVQVGSHPGEVPGGSIQGTSQGKCSGGHHDGNNQGVIQGVMSRGRHTGDISNLETSKGKFPREGGLSGWG